MVEHARRPDVLEQVGEFPSRAAVENSRMALVIVLDGRALDDRNVNGLGHPDDEPDYSSRQGRWLVLCAVSERAVEGGGQEEPAVQFSGMMNGESEWVVCACVRGRGR